MKQIYFILIIFAGTVITGCGIGGGGSKGEVVGVRQRSFRATVPLNMVYIKGGTFLMGQTDQDITFAQTSQVKQVTVPPFFMDETEISNSKYKQFVFWVRDSIAITNYLNDPKYYVQPRKGATADPNGRKFINWDYVEKNGIFSTRGKNASANQQKLQGMYYQGDDRVFDRNEIDIRLLKYNYALFTLRDACRTSAMIKQKNVRTFIIARYC